MDHSQISRRAAFGMFGATTALATFASQALGSRAARADGHYDLDDPATRADAIMRLRGSLDEAVQVGYVRGNYWGVVDKEVIPLVGLCASSIYQYKRRDDETLFNATAEVAYFTDFMTGGFIDEMTNPITGELIQLTPYRQDASLAILSSENRRPASERNIPGATFKNQFLPLRINGDDVDLVEEIRVKFPAPPGAEPFRYNEISTFRGSLSDLQNTDAPSVKCITHFNGVVTWRPWLKMDGHPGHMLGNAMGRQLEDFDGLPADYLEWTAKYHPDYLEEPEKVLDIDGLIASL